jgi:hypothetical protein
MGLELFSLVEQLLSEKNIMEGGSAAQTCVERSK